MKKSKKFILLIALALSLAMALGVSAPTQAAEFTNDGTIGADEIINDDLFISADIVVVDGIVNGDLFINSNNASINGTINGNLIITGAMIKVTGSVNGSLIFAGQSAVLDGIVNGTVYAASSSLTIGSKARIERNVFYAGYNLGMLEGSQVGRDVRMTGAQAVLNGEIGQDLLVDNQALELGGKVGRNAQAKVGAPNESVVPIYSLPFFQYPGAPSAIQPGIRVMDNANIGGSLSYSSPVEQASAIKAQPNGGVQFTQVETAKTRGKTEVNPGKAVGLWIVGRLRLLITLLLLGALAVWLLPGLLVRFSDQAHSEPLRAIGWGLVTLVGAGVSVFLLALMIVVVGILVGIVSLGGLAQVVFSLGFSSLGLASALFMFVLNYGSKLIVAHLVGRSILEWLAPAHAGHRVWPLVLGILIYVPLNGIPVFGWLIGLLTSLIGLGAIWLVFQGQRKAKIIPVQ
jgi:hypothetical protein